MTERTKGEGPHSLDGVPDSEWQFCHTCRFWKARKTTEDTGECRRRAPLLITVDKDDKAWWGWPASGAANWCGEFEPLGKYIPRPDEESE